MGVIYAEKSMVTNYLTPEGLLLFLKEIPKLECYHMDGIRKPLDPYSFQLLFKLQYTCALRISELLRIRKEDINLKTKILTIPKAKTGNRQKTTIVPTMVQPLGDYIKDWDDRWLLFPISRQTVIVWGKIIAEKAGLDLGEEQTEKSIGGYWTHLMRKSYSKWMLEKGASRELRMKKLRHTFTDSQDAYDVADLNALLEWEAKQFC